MAEIEKAEQECRYCVHLVPHPGDEKWLKDANGMPPWRCPFGRFNDPFKDGAVKRWFAWNGIWRPNNEVAKAQVNCPRFELHPKADKFTSSGRVLP